MALLLGLLGAPPSFAQSTAEARTLPTEFVANRIYVTAVTPSGDSLRLLTDTGGSPYLVLTNPAVERLGLTITDTLTNGPRSFPTTAAPSFQADVSIPQTQSDRALVVPNRGRAKILGFDDGRLGQSWFADRVWTFDYGAKQLLLHDSAESLSFDPDHTVPLAFQTDSTGERSAHHPRVEATIADSTYSFLYDSGATTVLTDSVRSTLEGPRRRGSGFVIASVFEHWQEEHPDWRVVEGASPAFRGTPIIQVPEVTIAGHTVGPVWFEKRPDQAFQRVLSGSMDRPVAGALGGSLFQYFRVTVDYPGARAFFQRLD